jgi:hypothetical protein
MADELLAEQIRNASEKELEAYIERPHVYRREAVIAAIEELKKRGRVFPQGQLDAIMAILGPEPVEPEAPAEETSTVQSPEELFREDPNAPLLYSKRVLYIFSVLFSTFFGSVLMAMNFYQLKNQKALGLVLGFGFLYAVLTGWLGMLVNAGNGIGIVFNIGGGMILTEYFWPKYIGAERHFRKRSFWIPLALGLLLSAIAIVLIVLANKAGV